MEKNVIWNINIQEIYVYIYDIDGVIWNIEGDAEINKYKYTKSQGNHADGKKYKPACEEEAVKVENERATTFNNVTIRVDPSFTLEMHIDTDDANSASLKNGDTVTAAPAADYLFKPDDHVMLVGTESLVEKIR